MHGNSRTQHLHQRKGGRCSTAERRRILTAFCIVDRRTDKLEPLSEALPILEFAAAETRKRAPHLTHPHLCLEAIKYGVEHGGIAGLRKVLPIWHEQEQSSATIIELDLLENQFPGWILGPKLSRGKLVSCHLLAQGSALATPQRFLSPRDSSARGTLSR